jgi:hypothetical protein
MQVTCLLKFRSFNGTSLFSAAKKKWESQYFHLNFAIPTLESMHLGGEPTLRAFSNKLGNFLQAYIAPSMNIMHKTGLSSEPWHSSPFCQQSTCYIGVITSEIEDHIVAGDPQYITLGSFAISTPR